MSRFGEREAPRPAADRHSGCRREQACQLASRHRHFADPFAHTGSHGAYHQLDVKRTLCQPSEQLSCFVVSDEDGQLVQRATLPPSSVMKKYRNEPYKAIKTSWSRSPYSFTPYSVPPVGGKGIWGPRYGHYVQLEVWL